MAVDLVLGIIIDNEPDNFRVFSDSLSVRTSLRNKIANNPLIVNIPIRMYGIYKKKSRILLGS